jgi:hypothetical protein
MHAVDDSGLGCVAKVCWVLLTVLLSSFLQNLHTTVARLKIKTTGGCMAWEVYAALAFHSADANKS